MGISPSLRFIILFSPFSVSVIWDNIPLCLKQAGGEGSSLSQPDSSHFPIRNPALIPGILIFPAGAFCSVKYHTAVQGPVCVCICFVGNWCLYLPLANAYKDIVLKHTFVVRKYNMSERRSRYRVNFVQVFITDYIQTASDWVDVTGSPMSNCSHQTAWLDIKPCVPRHALFFQHLLLHIDLTAHFLMKDSTSFTEMAPHCS